MPQGPSAVESGQDHQSPHVTDSQTFNLEMRLAGALFSQVPQSRRPADLGFDALEEDLSVVGVNSIAACSRGLLLEHFQKASFWP